MISEIDKGVIILQGSFSSRRFAHFYENNTFSSSKRVIFLRRKMTPGHYSARVIILLYTGNGDISIQTKFFRVGCETIINQFISQSIYQSINQILTPHLRTFLDEQESLVILGCLATFP